MKLGGLSVAICRKPASVYILAVCTWIATPEVGVIEEEGIVNNHGGKIG